MNTLKMLTSRIIYVTSTVFAVLSLSTLAEDQRFSDDKRPPQHWIDYDAITGRASTLRPTRELLGRCLRGRKASDKEIRDFLKRHYNVEVGDGMPPDRDVLVYLLGYFQVMGFKFKKPIRIHGSEEDGPKLVWRKNRDIYFAKNASHDVFTRKLDESSPNRSKTKVTIEFSNTLFEQLTHTLSDRFFLQHLFRTHFGFDVNPDRDRKNAPYARQMTKTEMTMLLKQLVDLPVAVTQGMKLKRVIRMRSGYSYNNHAADYDKETFTIRIFDKAYEKGRVGGHGSFIHELGHAVWANLAKPLKDDFIKTSWEKRDGKWKIKAGKENFVSRYSRENPEEDFSEHFRAYVDNSKLLKTKAKDKYQWLHKHLFPNSEFYARAHPKAQVYLKSENPDTAPPYLKGNLKDLVSFSVKYLKEKQEVRISCVIKGLYDDISGVKEFRTQFTPSDGGETVFAGPLECLDKAKGHYRHTRDYPLSQFKPDCILRWTFAMAVDEAGNERFFDLPPLQLKIRGTSRDRLKRPKEQIRPDQIQIKKEQKPNVFRVILPLKQLDGLTNIQIDWAHRERPYPDYDMTHVFGENILESLGKNSKSSAFINNRQLHLRVHFPDEFEPGNVEMSELYLEYKNKGKWGAKKYTIHPKNGLDDLGVFIGTKNSDRTRLTLDLNNMKLRSEYLKSGKNSEGGTKNFRLTLPVSGIQKEHKAKAWLQIQAPSGKKISRGGEVKAYPTENGKMILDIILELEKNPEEGKYLLRVIDIEEEYPRKDLDGVKQLLRPLQLKRVDLLKRGIRRTFSIESLD